MMGTKIRTFAPLPREVSLEDLVPEDNFYRRLEATLDLSFVRDLVKDHYACAGRPSIDPVVFFRLQLVMFFEDVRSERRLMEVAADRLSVRWYLGYDLHESLPDHSSLTKIRERYGLSVFRCFFERIVEMCFEAGLVWGEELYFDATKVEANASLRLASPRFASLRLASPRLTLRGRARFWRTWRTTSRSTWRRSSLNKHLSSKVQTLEGSPLWWDPRVRKGERWHRTTCASTVGSQKLVASTGR
jgi:transposase